jgi:hypothetical protein
VSSLSKIGAYFQPTNGIIKLIDNRGRQMIQLLATRGWWIRGQFGKFDGGDFGQMTMRMFYAFWWRELLGSNFWNGFSFASWLSMEGVEDLLNDSTFPGMA